MIRVSSWLLLLIISFPAAALPANLPKNAFFTTTDGIRLHYLEAGSGPAIVFEPGWTMLGVPELMTYVDQFGTTGVRALVLVDGFVWDKQNLQTISGMLGFLKQMEMNRAKFTNDFVAQHVQETAI